MNQQPSYHRIRRIKVTGGFLSGLDLEFHNELNTVIGSRGSGKSTVVENIRHGLNVMPGREGDPLRRRVTSMIEKNLAGGRVELTVETKDGICYTVNRSAGEEASITNSDGVPLPPSVSVNHIFGASVYSQNQIEGIAENPRYQLDLIDGFEVDKLAAVSQRVNDVKHHLESNSARILPLVIEKQNLEGSLSQLDSVVEKLKAFDALTGQNTEEINRAHALKALRGRETMALNHSIEKTKSNADGFRPWLGRLSESVVPFFTQDIMTGPNAAYLSKAVNDAHSCIAQAEAALASAVAAMDDATNKLSEQKVWLDLVHVDQESQFRSIVEKQQQDLAKSAERAQLEKQHNEMLFRQRRLAEVISEIRALEIERSEMRAKLSEVRDERFAIRHSVAERLNARLNPAIRIRVAQSADQDDYRAFLETALKDAGIQHKRVAASLSSEISPDELADLVRANDAANLAPRGGINPQQAAAVIRELASLPRLLELQIVDMNEVPTIELCDNGIYKDSGNLSTGQKCTAILPILLWEGNTPLIIDQPEDNLDNRFVYDTIVAALKSVKPMRQLIFVTHNPNIPVLGDAARVIVMQSDGLSGSVKTVGDVDGCRAEIVDLLEGGKEAFDKRKAKYDGPNP
jgi:energy-coupling factor transporter ATP-binding protein EcfA2